MLTDAREEEERIFIVIANGRSGRTAPLHVATPKYILHVKENALVERNSCPFLT